MTAYNNGCRRLCALKKAILTKMHRSISAPVRMLGAPEGTRTPDLLIRSQTLYPAELPAHILLCVPLENVFYYSVIRGESQPFFSKNFEKKANGQLALNFAGRVFSSLPLSENEHRIDKYFATFYNIV